MTISRVTSLAIPWQTAPERIILTPGDVHVWRADLDMAPPLLQLLRKSLSTDEQARAERFSTPINRDHYVAGRGILRDLLAQYLGTRAGDLSFCYNPQGKPALVPGSGTVDLRFNVSHSHGLALFAFAMGRDVGVDLEFIRPFVTEDRVAERFFSAQEVAALRATPEVAQTEAFFHCWTRKEAYVKARGKGLGIDLASFTVSLAQDQMAYLPITGNDGPEAARWSIRSLAPGDGYVAAVATIGADWPLALWQRA